MQTKWSFTMKMYLKNLTVLSQHRNTYYFNLRPEMWNIFLYNFKTAMRVNIRDYIEIVASMPTTFLESLVLR